MLFRGSFLQLLTVNIVASESNIDPINLCIYFVLENIKQRECLISTFKEKLNRAIAKKLKWNQKMKEPSSIEDSLYYSRTRYIH